MNSTSSLKNFLTLPLWKVLRFLPESWLTLIKHKTSAQFRYLIRQKLGADYRNIPDTIISVPDGRKFHIGPDMVYWGLYYGLGYEPEVTSILTKFVEDHETVLDIGANFGWYSTLFPVQCGSSVKVHAFEPVPSTFERLVEHVELNHLCDSVSVNRLALSDQSGTAHIHLFRNRSHSLASLSTLGEGEYDVFDTPLDTLDEFLSAHNIGQVSFIKIDVEGNELAVLRGAVKSLSKPDAPIIMVEINNDTSSSFDYTAKDIWECLKSYGYDRFYGMLDSKTLAPIEDLKDLMDIANVVMLRKHHEDSLANSSVFASFKAVPGMVICGKSNVIDPKLASSDIKMIHGFWE